MSNIDSLTINKNDSDHYNYPENSQSNEIKPTNFFSPYINSTHIPNNISINEDTRKKDFIKFNNQNLNKKTLVLDLDETLVHSSMTPFPNGSDLTIEIKVAGNKYNVYVLKRPFLEEFLKEMSYLYEIIIFTASLAEYAEPLLEILDKSKIIKYKLNRTHCLYYQGNYIKDLKVIKRNIKDLIIIDNNPASYVLNQENGIPILSWFDNPNDNELMKLVPLLKYLSTVSDVRTIIKQIISKDDDNKLDFNIIDKIIDKKTNNDNKDTHLNNQFSKKNLNINVNTSNINNNIISNVNNNNIPNVNNNTTSNVNNNNIIINSNANNNAISIISNNNEKINKHESTSLNKDNNKNLTKFIYIKKEISNNNLNKTKRMKSNLNNKINYTYDNNKINNNINNNNNNINNVNNNNKSNNNINIINNYNNKNLNNNVVKNINNKDYSIINTNNINNSNNAIQRQIKSFNNLCINSNNNINIISKPKFNLINNQINPNINESSNNIYQNNIKNINSNEQNNFNNKNDNNNFSIINDFDKKNNKNLDDIKKNKINYIKVNQENKDYNVEMTQPNSKIISINNNNNIKINQYNQNNNKILDNQIVPKNNKIIVNQIKLSNSSKNFYTNRPGKSNANINIINTSNNNGNVNTLNPNRGSLDFSNYNKLNNMNSKNNKDNFIQFNNVKLNSNPKTPKKESITKATVVKLTNHNSEYKNNINQDIYYNNLAKQNFTKNLFGDNKIYENKNNFLSTDRNPKVKIVKKNNNIDIDNNILDQKVIININNPVIANYYEDNRKNSLKNNENINKATKVKINNKIKNNDKNFINVYENLKTEYNIPNKFLGNCKIKKIEVNGNKGQISPYRNNKIKVKQYFDKENGKEDKILIHNISSNKIKSTSKGPFNRQKYLQENFEINN